MSAYLSPGAAAKALGVSTQCLVLWVDQGKLSAPVLTDGGHRRYHRGEVLRLAEAQAWKALATHRGSELAALRNDIDLIARTCVALGQRVERLLTEPEARAS